MSVVKEAIRICHSEERRARCGFQLIMSFGARGNDYGSPLIFDGESVGSGMDVVNQVHEFLSHFLFGSIEEGTRHIYFDWHNLKGLPGTKEVPKPKGTGIMRLNDEWKELYYEAFKQAKIKIFLISDAWLNSPNCMEEFGWLLEIVGADPDQDGAIFFWLLTSTCTKHARWPDIVRHFENFEKKIKCPPGTYKKLLIPYHDKGTQDEALAFLMGMITEENVQYQPRGAAKPEVITEAMMKMNYSKAFKAGVKGFEAEPPED